MGWSSDVGISVDDLVDHVKGFVDMLVLASGFLSSGSEASWDAHNINKALQWGLFFEKVKFSLKTQGVEDVVLSVEMVFERMRVSEDYDALVKELDMALFTITTLPHFPQGLKYLSSATLIDARKLALKHLFQTCHLSETHLVALLTASIDMDLETISGSSDATIDSYTEKLIRQTKSLNLYAERKTFMNNCIASHGPKDSRMCEDPVGIICRSSITSTSNTNLGIINNNDNSSCIIKEMLIRRAAVSCLSSAETSMDALRRIISRNTFISLGNDHVQVSNCNDDLPCEENSSGLVLWNQWRSNGLSYLLDKRTMRLLSGASLIFSTPKDQWAHIFGNLEISSKCQSDVLEIIELVLMALVSDRWKSLLEHLMSFSNEYIPLSEQYYGLSNFIQSSFFQLPKEGRMSSKENDLMDYLMVLFGSQHHMLWKLPPVLVAAAVPSSSMLFRLYLNDIERQLKGVPCSSCYCKCKQESKDHISCEVAERVWFLYVLHVQSPFIMAA